MLVPIVVFLFLGVAVAPSINSSVVKSSDDLVELTSQACGIQGFGNTTVKLTKQQYSDLEQYLVDFRARLNQTTTRDETIPIFREAVMELDKYGLLPKGMSVEQAQRFVLGRNQTSLSSHRLNNILKKYPLFVNSSWNLMCLVYGFFAPGFKFFGPLGIVFFFFFVMEVMFLLARENGWDIGVKNLDRAIQLFALPALIGILLIFFDQFFPISILNLIFEGDEGWITTIGLLGIQYRMQYSLIIGFTGLKIFIPPNCYFLGFAPLSYGLTTKK